MNIMYNLSQNTSWESNPSRLHCNLMPFLSFFFLFLHLLLTESTVNIHDDIWATSLLCPVDRLWYSCFPWWGHHHSLFTLSLSPSFTSLALFPFPLITITTEYSVTLLRTRHSVFFLCVSRSQLVMYKMKRCYKPNKNVLPLDSPTVNIWPLISVNILHNYVWLWILHGASHWAHGKMPNCRV